MPTYVWFYPPCRYTKSCDQTADATFYQNKFEQLQNAMDLVGFSEEVLIFLTFFSAWGAALV